MKTLTVLLKSIFLNAFRSEGKKKSNMTGFWGMLLSGGVFGILFVGMTTIMGPIFRDLGLIAEYLTIIFLVSQVIVLIFGTVIMINIMFFSKDAEMLLSLPIKSNTIFVAKMMYVYLTELMLSAFMVIVTGVTFGIICGFSAVNYLLLLLAVLIVPTVPLILSALLSVPIMYLISYFKNKSVLATVLLVAVFSGFMYLYMSFFMGFSNVESGNVAIPGETVRQTMKYLYPNISLARIVSLTSANYLADFVALVAGTAGLFLVTLLIASFTFQRGMASQLEEAKSERGGKVEYVQNTAFKSFLLKEIREILRNPGLAFYCIFQIVFSPLMISIYGNMNFSDGTTSPAEDIIIKQGLAFFFATLMAIGINYTAMSSISREGVNFDISKTFPAPYTFQIRVKVFLADIVMFAGILTSFLAMVIILKAFVLHSILYFGFALILGNGINHLMVYYDAKDPKLDWESITVALKNSKATLIAMLVSLAIAIPLLGGFIAISLAGFSDILLVIAFMVYWAVFYGIAVLLNFLFRKLLKNNIERLIAEKE